MVFLIRIYLKSINCKLSNVEVHYLFFYVGNGAKNNFSIQKKTSVGNCVIILSFPCIDVSTNNTKTTTEESDKAFYKQLFCRLNILL